MAFNSNARNNQPAVANDNWKAQGFINIYLPTPDGGRRKIGSIALKESKAYEAALLKRLSTDPLAIQKMAEAIQLDFQLADKEVKENELGF
tara:strand:+ start:1514 stop:1786 length:273 start_codon:yes stop_codon:yes gene_type:complete